MLIALLLAAVSLVPPFGQASAAAISDTDGLAVEIVVGYTSGAEAVIARPYSAFEELPPTVLSDQGDDTYRGVVVFPTSENWSVGFEAFRSDGATDLSDGGTLLEMGVDPIVVSVPPVAPAPNDGLVPGGGWWLVVAIGLAMAALVVLGIWTFAPGAEDEGQRTED